MPKLKTLKDLNKYYDEECVLQSELKKESIKWVKDCGCFKYYKIDRNERCSSCWRFVKFHNITEEDLK